MFMVSPRPQASQRSCDYDFNDLLLDWPYCRIQWPRIKIGAMPNFPRFCRHKGDSSWKGQMMKNPLMYETFAHYGENNWIIELQKVVFQLQLVMFWISVSVGLTTGAFMTPALPRVYSGPVWTWSVCFSLAPAPPLTPSVFCKQRVCHPPLDDLTVTSACNPCLYTAVNPDRTDFRIKLFKDLLTLYKTILPAPLKWPFSTICSLY